MKDNMTLTAMLEFLIEATKREDFDNINLAKEEIILRFGKLIDLSNNWEKERDLLSRELNKYKQS